MRYWTHWHNVRYEVDKRIERQEFGCAVAQDIWPGYAGHDGAPGGSV